MKKINLVTGTNGHLGNNIVRVLLKNGKTVRASVRNTKNSKPFDGLDIELVYADLLDKESLRKIMKDVDILYQVAAIFRHWSKNPEKDIIQANFDITRNILEVAAEFKVRKIVYVSSMSAISHENPPINESTWNNNYFSNNYYKSKIVSEKLAWKLAKKHNLNLTTVLPSAMVGPNNFDRLTTTMKIYRDILNNKMAFDPNFSFNVVDVRDVAQGALLAAEKGRIGERYLLATEPSIRTTEIIDIARSVNPTVSKLKTKSKGFLKFLAFLSETMSKINGKEPLMMRNQIDLYYKADSRCDISKSKNELGYNPRSPVLAIKETFEYLLNRE